MIRKAIVILIIALVISILYGTTPLTKGSLVLRQTTQDSASSAPAETAIRNIDTFPSTEDFDGGSFPPTDWSFYDQDGQTPSWGMRYYWGHGDFGHCVEHAQGSGPAPEDGWLVSPPIDVPSGGGFTLSFWSLNQNPSYYSNGGNSVLVSAGSPDPTDEEYTEIWHPLTVSAGWYCNQVDLTPWQGQTIYVAFRYFGAWAHTWFLDDITFEPHSGIHEFPWVENFESGVFPPYYWGRFDEDGTDTQWDLNGGINHTPDGGYSALHQQGSPGDMQDGWLVTPHIQVPEGSAFSLSFWSCNSGADIYGRNSVHISTGSNVPGDGEFTEIWSPITVSVNWTHNYIDLTPWGGQTIVLAFRYQGDFQQGWYLDDVTLDYFLGIQDFPYAEDFESGVFPPYYWTAFDQDGSGTYWSWNDIINHSEEGTCSAMHTWDQDEPTEEGWLVSPKINLPADGSIDMSFWSYNYWTQYYGSNALCISIGSPDPTDGDYVQIWSPSSVSENWEKTNVDLSLWAGMSIYIAFVYQGMTAHDWYLDDVTFSANILDDQPPVITHLPLINTPRDDAPYSVYADVTDDLIYNNGISSVYLYYRVNDGEEIGVEMQALRTGYHAVIPQQVLGTQISYFIRAFDASPASNMSETTPRIFQVNDPVWLHYHDGIQTMWAGMTDLPWGAGMLFANPYFGEGVPLKVQAIFGSLFYDDTASLRVYSADDEYLTNLTPLMDPFEAYYSAGIGTETYIPELSINSPYFYVTVEDINPGNYFAAEDIYFPNRCFLIWQGQHIEFSAMSFFNVWMIEVLVESGASPYPAPELSIITASGYPVLQWTEVPGADYYNVYGSDDPYAPEPWELYDSTMLLEVWVLDPVQYKFFKATAVFGEEARALPAHPAVQKERWIREGKAIPYQQILLRRR